MLAELARTKSVGEDRELLELLAEQFATFGDPEVGDTIIAMAFSTKTGSRASGLPTRTLRVIGLRSGHLLGEPRTRYSHVLVTARGASPENSNNLGRLTGERGFRRAAEP